MVPRRISDYLSSPCLLPGRLTAEEWILKGDCCMREARLEEAFRCYCTASRLCPDCAQAWKHSGVVLGIMGFYLEAAEALDGAIRICPGDPEAWKLKGFCLFRMYRFSDALACFERALVLHRDDPSALHWRDLALEAMSRDEADPLRSPDSRC